MSGGIITTTLTDYLARIEAGERGRFDIAEARQASGGDARTANSGSVARDVVTQPGGCGRVPPTPSVGDTLAGAGAVCTPALRDSATTPGDVAGESPNQITTPAPPTPRRDDASALEGHPAEATSGCGGNRFHFGLRMDGNGITDRSGTLAGGECGPVASHVLGSSGVSCPGAASLHGECITQ